MAAEPGIALRFTALCRPVAVLDIDADAAGDTAREAKDASSPAVFSTYVDVADPQSVNDAVRAVQAALPPIEVLANIAGISAPTRFENITLEEWERVFAIMTSRLKDSRKWQECCASKSPSSSKPCARIDHRPPIPVGCTGQTRSQQWAVRKARITGSIVVVSARVAPERADHQREPWLRQ